MNECLEEIGGCFDCPDPSDFIAEDIIGGEVIQREPTLDLRTRFFRAKDQGATVMCTAFALLHAFEIMNELEHEENIDFDAKELWRVMKEIGLTFREGSTLQNALKILLQIGAEFESNNYEIKGYARIQDVSFDGLYDWLGKGYPIYTGARMSSLLTRQNNGFFVEGGAGHAFCIVGGDLQQRELTCVNSYGEKWGAFDDGSFIIPEKDLVNLYSCYVIHDKEDEGIISKFNRERAKMRNKAIWHLANKNRQFALLEPYCITIQETAHECNEYIANI